MTVLLWIAYALTAYGLGAALVVTIVDDRHHPISFLTAQSGGGQ